MQKLIIPIFFILASTMYSQVGTDAPWMNSFAAKNNQEEPSFDQIVTAFNAYWEDKNPTVKGSGYKPFKRWESLYQHYLNPDGTLMTKQQLWEVWNSTNQFSSVQSDDSEWISVGPLTHTNTGSWSSGQGRVNAFTVDPSDETAWYIGAPAGGIWASKDSGNTWSPLSDQLPQIGVSGIAIDPNNSDIIYIATGDDDSNDSDAVGVLKSTDGGETWDFSGLNVSNSPVRLSEIYIDPTDSQTVWVASSAGIFKTTNGGTSWSNMRSGNFRDIKLKPGDSNTVYGATNNQFFRTTNGGASWQAISNGFPSGFSRLVIDVTPANPEVVYIFASDGSFATGRIYKSSNSGLSFTETFNGGQDIFESSQAWFDFAFAVSDTNENEIYTGVLNLWKSSNSGANFIKISQWSAPASASYTHADIHRLGFINGRLFCGSDGGIYTSTNGGTNFTDHTSGLAIGQFYRISVSKNSSDQIAGGLQDNGGYSRKDGLWQNYYGADGMETAIDPNNSDLVFGFTQNGGGLYVSSSGGASLDESYNGPEGGNWITPLQFAKDDRLYAGYSRVYEFDFCSFTWQIKSPSFGQFIDRLITDPNNEDIMYVAVNNQLYRSEDKGSTFSFLNSFNNNISGIEVNNGNSNLIYITVSGVNGAVFIGDLSSGSLVLDNITGSLPDIPKLVIKHQGKHPDNPLYVGTGLGVWRYDDTIGDWEPFENGLPNVPVRDLEIGLQDNKITAATYGRGVWQTALETQELEADLALQSLETTSGQSIMCGNEGFIATVFNSGTSTQTSFDIFYQIEDESNTVSWTGTLAIGSTAEVTLPALSLEVGNYNIQAEIIAAPDDFLNNNNALFNFTINSSGEADVIYDFETESDNLLITDNNTSSANCGETTPLWERGAPVGAVLNQTSSGNNVYGTNLDGNHPDNILEYLNTPCYDLSAMENPIISFQMAFDLELDWDILYMEYSSDDGLSWNLLGSANDDNWYNSDTTPGGNCFNCPGAQWTGTEAQMQEYMYSLDAIANETNVIFRFVFHSDQSVNEEGVIIDDLKIENSTLSTEEFQTTAFSIFPNPSKDIFNILKIAGEEYTITVYDLAGKVVVQSQPLGQDVNTHSLDMSAYTRGMYVLEATSNTKKIIKKIILQ